jgi:hypothetical protein
MTLSEPEIRGGFPIDEEQLRQAVLKAYQDKKGCQGKDKRTLDAIRQFLSGAPGGATVLQRYWFEEDPEASARSFVTDLEKAAPGLSRSVLEPLIAAAARMEKKKSSVLAPNISVYVSSLAGAVALKAGLDETLACAVLSAAILGLSRVGRKPFESALPAPDPDSSPGKTEERHS